VPEPLKKETFEVEKYPPKKPLEMTSRSVPPPVSVVPVLVAPDPFQMGSGRYRPTPYGRFF
jgi:hypothetical protein